MQIRAVAMMGCCIIRQWTLLLKHNSAPGTCHHQMRSRLRPSELPALLAPLLEGLLRLAALAPLFRLRRLLMEMRSPGGL